ncbi:mannitol-1-phosphate 5-dehydrogenase [Pseudarthrobacter sp. PvP004]|uniref:Mannitol-1-phosphate 5-dehydrogenase n=1 Tax=Paenarthrobacter aurescens (strain TC1) TaxID=290340 RepID=MTLD_PAEAT|nr:MULTISPECIES: mannitol-1-phosphate 5-dehydrogenase [Micrococcaceae]A1RBC4.1 RecName: Full=Mannitol-1-phosphate 5-dehydrogenase [Paenarthrobacter aurescens TC1]ABM09759.1 mannitol-1-phosphate dehydrogenase [Paenarthrobacter aurescens TC1]MBP2268588.1 mannitol-1-phosphate 5-dehydrogenase [Pseudarthrobacter sp. PvP004]
MKAVHFGAGNIGRGFVGLLLHEAGYEVVFADVADALISQLASASSYDVHEVGENPAVKTVSGFRAFNSASQEAAVVEEISTADVLTTAVGPHILKFVAPVIARGLAVRPADLPPLQVMACENAINATDLLHTEIRAAWDDSAGDLDAVAVFANTAVDRIVPNQAPGQGLDVTVETFYEWVIDRTPFGGNAPKIPGATFVDELGPYIERKLFTVNTGHASAAYFGYAAGLEKISDAMADPAVAAKVRAVLEETKELLVAKHGFEEAEQEAYVQKILSRFTNPHLPDTVNRVGRAPLRKLSRHERFVGPAAELAERGVTPAALLEAMSAALRFDDGNDDEAVELTNLLSELDAAAAVERITELTPTHPLFPALQKLVEDRQAEA